uniref:Putative ovule protein n=1 Tax=Solanum chacoense TaxID=4108 RepID=A0A0V0GNP3_SOLCH
MLFAKISCSSSSSRSRKRRSIINSVSKKKKKKERSIYSPSFHFLVLLFSKGCWFLCMSGEEIMEMEKRANYPLQKILSL